MAMESGEIIDYPQAKTLPLVQVEEEGYTTVPVGAKNIFFPPLFGVVDGHSTTTTTAAAAAATCLVNVFKQCSTRLPEVQLL